MATNDLIFNPLLKKGFQYSDNGGGGDTQQKVTKCITSDELDAVADGEIFEWQGVETIINGTTLENGFFYKKAAGSTYTIPAGSLYFDVISDINTDLFTIPAGRYYQLELVNLHVYGVAQNTVNGVRCSWFTNYDDTPDHVGNYVVFKNGEVTTIATLGMSGYANTDNKGNALYNATRNNFGEKNIYTFVSDNGYLADVVLVFGDDTASTYLIGKVVNNQMCAGDNNYFNGAYYSGGKLTEDYTVDSSTYTRIDTQPRLQNIANGADGSITIATDVNISGDLTVKGTQTVVHTEAIESENDYIELRADNPLGLASGEMSGIEVNNYDGNGTDCVLAVDATGWARVGDKNGTLQKLATIEENPTDGSFVQYDATAKELKTAAIPEATTTAAGLMSAADKTLLNNLKSTISINSILCNARVTGSGNYLQFFIPCFVAPGIVSASLTITTATLFADNAQKALVYDNFNLITPVPLCGISFEVKLTTSDTAWKTYQLGITGSIQLVF